MDRSQPTSGNLMDAHQRLIADILTRYRALLMLSTIQAKGDGANEKPEAIAVVGISMKMEFDGLYASIKELLTLSRRMKELWVFGPLGRDDQEDRTRDEQTEREVARVAEMLGRMEADGMRALAEKCGGAWEPLGVEGGGEGQTQVGGGGGGVPA